ncbi:MAG: preprotein translocase subunit SecG [Bacteriovoracaceae bacterium]|nr:preprotein translocase subunit SecG [Bacteriovoracaceae bacterium]
MITTLMVFHAVISVLLILVVLLQFGKGAEAGLFSGGGGDAVFSGSQKGNILSKVTVVLAIIFLGNSVFLAKLQSSRSGSSLLDSEAPVAIPLNSGNVDPAPKAETKTETTTKKETKTETK